MENQEQKDNLQKLASRLMLEAIKITLPEIAQEKHNGKVKQ